MFEIKNEEAVFRLSFIERLEEPEDRRQDLIMCWLEIKGTGISLQCQCELTLFDLTDLKKMLSTFYAELSTNTRPALVSFAPRIKAFTFEFRAIEGADYIGFNFTASPQLDEGWTLKGGIAIDQSYFPFLISGIDSILSS